MVASGVDKVRLGASKGAHDPLIPVLIPDQVDQGYWVIRSRCESANKVPGV